MWIFLGFILFRVYVTYWTYFGVCLLSNLSFQSFLWVLVQPALFLFSFYDSDDRNIRHFVIVPWVFETVWLFNSVSLSFSLNNYLYHSVLKFPDSFLCFLYFCFHPIIKFFISVKVLFSSKSFIWFFFIFSISCWGFLFLLWDLFFICVKCIHNCWLKHFCAAALKSSSDN